MLKHRAHDIHDIMTEYLYHHDMSIYGGLLSSVAALFIFLYIVRQPACCQYARR